MSLALLCFMQAISDWGGSGRPARLEPKTWCVDSRAHETALRWVLLIDDDVVNTRALSRWLKAEFGIDTRSARTIAQAEAWLRGMPTPKAIITDFDLEAGETGALVLQQLREWGVNAPATVLTGAPIRARTALRRFCLGSVPVLSKSGFHDALRDWLRPWVGVTGEPVRVHAG